MIVEFSHLRWMQHKCNFPVCHRKWPLQVDGSVRWCHCSRIWWPHPGRHPLMRTLLFPRWCTVMDYHLLCMSSVLFHHLLCTGQLQCFFESMDLIKKSRKREILEEGTKRNILINVGDSAEIRASCQNRGIDLSKGLSLGECNYPLIPVTTFSQTDVVLVWIYREFSSAGTSCSVTNHKLGRLKQKRPPLFFFLTDVYLRRPELTYFGGKET